MIGLGIILLILGYVLKVAVLQTIGVVLLVIGAVLVGARFRWSPGGRQTLLVLTPITA